MIAKHKSRKPVLVGQGRCPVSDDLPKVRTGPDKTTIERQIAATDKQVDQVMYEPCRLTEEGTKTLEGGLR